MNKQRSWGASASRDASMPGGGGVGGKPSSGMNKEDELKNQIEALFLKYEGVEPDEDTIRTIMYVVREAINSQRAATVDELLGLLPEKTTITYKSEFYEPKNAAQDGFNIALDQVKAILLSYKEGQS